jgi:hypothetical protein
MRGVLIMLPGDVAKALREELSPIREETAKALDNVSIGPGSLAEFTVMSSAKHSALVVSVRASYHASATAGVRVRWLYSPDGASFDSPEDAEAVGNYEDLTFAAGATRQRTVVIPLFQPYVKVQVVNRDSSYAAAVTAWRTLLR